MTSQNRWTQEAIRALGPTTDLPTLGAIFECSRWKAYQMARHGEWGRLGIKVLSIGSKYRVVVQSAPHAAPSRPTLRAPYRLPFQPRPRGAHRRTT